MRKFYLLVAILLLAVIAMNAVTLYLLVRKASTEDVRRMIELSRNDTSVPPAIVELIKSLPSPTQQPGPKGDKGDSIVGPKGDSVTGSKGDKGDSIKGDQGVQGIPGIPGREAELLVDKSTGELYYRYSGDTVWSLVPSYEK